MKSVKSLAWLALFFLCSTRLFAFNYTNQALGFSATLPDGLPDLAIETRVDSLVRRGNLDSSKGPVEIIVIQDLGGPIGREDFSKRKDKPQNLTLEKTAWKSFQIDVFKVGENLNSVPFVTLNAQVPLKPHAIQLTVSGPASDESKLRTEMQKILASIDGPTNWLTDEQRARPGINWIAVAAGVMILLIGKIRISRHYGLKGSSARVAGFFILILGIVLPPGLVWTLKLLAFLGVQLSRSNALLFLIGWIAFHGLLIWGAVVLLVKEYGNAYAKEEGNIAPPGQEPPKIIKRLITECRMCKVPIPPEQQETVRTCPSCGADLSRAR